jgi:general secretion pathway protein G
MKIYTRLAIAITLLACSIGCTNKERRNNEALLKEDLYHMRSAIDQYTQDKNKAPQTLNDLVVAGYLHAIPKDPCTHSAETWQVEQEDVLMAVDETSPGITDVHSGCDRISSDGSRYSTW